MNCLKHILCPFSIYYPEKVYVCSKYEYNVLKNYFPSYIKLFGISSSQELPNITSKSIVFVKYSAGSGGDVLEDNFVYKSLTKLYREKVELLYLTPSESNYLFYKHEKRRGLDVHLASDLVSRNIKDNIYRIIVALLLLLFFILGFAIIISLSTINSSYSRCSVVNGISQELFLFENYTQDLNFSLIGEFFKNNNIGTVNLFSQGLNTTFTLNRSLPYSVPCEQLGYNCQKINVSLSSYMFQFSSHGLSAGTLVYQSDSSNCSPIHIPIFSVYMDVRSYSSICLVNPTLKSLSSDIEILGSGFIFSKNNSFSPLLQLDDKFFAVNFDPKDCNETSLYWICSRITFKVSINDIDPFQNYNLKISNNHTSGGIINRRFFLPSFANISTIVTPKICCKPSGSQWVNITGKGFIERTKIILTRDGAIYQPIQTRFISSKLISIEIPLSFSNGVYFPISSNSNCEIVSKVNITYFPMSFITHIDKTLIFSGIANEVTIYTSGLIKSPGSISIGNGDIILNVLFSIDKFDFSKIIVKVPSGIADGRWDLILTDENGCEAINNLISFNSTSTASIHNLTVDLPIFTSEETSEIKIFGSRFENGLLIYLYKINSSFQTSIGVSKVLDKEITAIIPSGLNQSTFDLAILNQDGSLAILKNVIKITTNKKPKILDISPLSQPLEGGISIISGLNFNNVSVSLECQNNLNSTVVINKWTIKSINVTFPHMNESICIVKVTNSDGLFEKFGSIIFKNQSVVQGFQYSKSNMKYERKSFCMVSGQTSWNSKFIYAIGGRNTSGLLKSIEVTSIDPSGNIGNWSLMKDFTENIGHHECITLGSYLYLFGGLKEFNNSFVELDTVYRSKILDPKATPTAFASLLFYPSNITIVPKGVYYYKVSANFGINDLIDPNGESLTGNTISIYVPNRWSYKVNLTWDSIPNAVSYNIYKSWNGTEFYHLLTINSNSFIDNSSIPLNILRIPLKIGDLGNWIKLSSNNLLSKRWSHSVTYSKSQLDENLFHIYSIGGRGINSTYLNTIEIMNITILPQTSVKSFEKHILSSWRFSNFILKESRSDLSSIIVSSGNYSKIYIGSGETSSFNFSNQIESQLISITGEFTTNFKEESISIPLLESSFNSSLNSTQNSTTTYLGNSGYCLFSTQNSIIFLGGIREGIPSERALSSKICLNETNCDQDLSWEENPKINLKEKRYQFKCVKDSIYFYIAGGTNFNRTSNTLEQTIL